MKKRIRQGRRGLSLEVVALRDIAANEEIFIDYGPSWEAEWDRHVASWKPPPDDGSYIPISTMNRHLDEYLLNETERSGAMKPLLGNVRLGCRVFGKYHPCEILNKVHRMGTTAYEVKVRKWSHEGEDETDYYGTFNWTSEKETDYHLAYNWTFANDSVAVQLSRADIRFFPGPHSSDQYLEGTFRHHIGVPTGMWPEHWMNLIEPFPWRLYIQRFFFSLAAVLTVIAILM